MNTAAGKVSCKGDASQSKTCNLPLGVGSLTFNAMSFPIKKGSTSVSVDLALSSMLPGALAHTEITGFTPSSITTGQTATMTGTGTLDEDVSGANFDLEMNTAAGKVSCKGDASQSKTCNLPLGVGSLTF